MDNGADKWMGVYFNRYSFTDRLARKKLLYNIKLIISGILRKD